MTDATTIRTTHLTYPAPSAFSFDATVHASGWGELAPLAWDDERQAVRYVERVASGRVLLMHFSAGDGHVAIEVQHEGELTDAEQDDCESAAWWMFRLDEDLSPFYALCRERGGKWEQVAAEGLGRLLRSPNPFDDVVKVICTTNTRWGHTRKMIERLVNAYGEPFPGNPALKTFPSAGAIASVPLEAFAATVRMGYRAPYVHALAERVAARGLDLERLCDGEVPFAEVRDRLLTIKGVGSYAAATLLAMLGRYSELPVDTAFREFVSRAYFSGRQPSDDEARAVYADWGEWKYLAYWFDIWQDAQSRREQALQR